MSFKDTSIEVRNLGKSYNIYNRPQDRLKQSLIPRIQQLVGRPANRYFREFWALRDVSFEVQKGEAVGIIGRNGSGKSTLLQIICGTLSPTQGTVETDGRIAALLELGSGFNPEFSGRENVYLNGAILGLSKSEIDSRFEDIASFADIGEFIEQPVKIYSSGMVVRLAFAVQAMVDPDILVVDEALAVGDEKFRRKCFARLDELRKKGTSILFVSHSGRQIIELCQKALLLERGRRLLYTHPLKAVRAYQKLIYAPPDEQNRLLQEFRVMDASGVEEVGAAQPQTLPAGEASTVSFDPGLVPETTEIYPSQGAEILSFKVLDSENRQVNVLAPNQPYQFEVAGRILSDSADVYFAIHIRTVSGVLITGQRYPEAGKFLPSIEAGQSFRVIYGFQMDLQPGAYFVGGGVWSNHEPNCLHRITDALMFRISQPSKTGSFGYVDLSSKEPVIELA